MHGFRLRWLGTLTAALGATFATSCVVEWNPAPTPPPPEIGARPPRHERLAALLSVYYHALATAEPEQDAADGIEPLEPTLAAKILRADQTEVGESRRRHATAQLAVADSERPDFRAALLILLDRDDGQMPVGDAEATLRLIELVLAANVGLEPPAQHALVIGLLDSLFGPAFKLCFTRRQGTRLRCPSSGQTRVRARLQVRRPYDTVARAFDPQNWDECSDFFVATYVAEEILGSYPIDKQHNGLPAPFPPIPGSGWDGVLFEHFEMALGPFSVSQFKNFLDIDGDLDVGAEEWSIDYDLRESIWSKVFGISAPNGILVDRGGIAVKQSGAWSTVRARKVIKFTRTSLNLAACALLAAMGDATAEIACCTPP